MCNKILNRNSLSTCVYSREVQGSPSTIQRKGELHHKINALCSKLYEYVSNSKFNKFAVTYDRISAEIKCQCLLFESRRILCCHSLSALSFEGGTHVSRTATTSFYWSQEAKNLMIWYFGHNICEFALEFEELTAILHCAYDNAMVEMQRYKAKSKEKCSPSRGGTRGRPKNRLGSKTEKQIANASKKKKTKTLSECSQIPANIIDML
ncbi:hypothetical protein Ahy_A09g042775 [Arachis hypogaea]|uniref:SWIM-type domain-containing protein n=1 Tax=Arachis hypogaea TaxID=3818 RepID=A0A445BGQ4_ARAHY|nr:hypothetical protein Ahy_A09g042775 [Arachis hypogaea]